MALVGTDSTSDALTSTVVIEMSVICCITPGQRQ